MLNLDNLLKVRGFVQVESKRWVHIHLCTEVLAVRSRILFKTYTDHARTKLKCTEIFDYTLDTAKYDYNEETKSRLWGCKHTDGVISTYIEVNYLKTKQQ